MTPDVAEATAPVDIEIEEQLADYFGTSEFDIGAADFRAPVPAGTVLAEGVLHDADGSQSKVQITKGHSLVSAGGRELPERTRVYNTITGDSSDVPTAALRQQLRKKRPDGSRIYSLKRPEGIVDPKPIDDTCQICVRNRGGRKKNFYSEDALYNHYVAFHTNEWNAMERDREIKSRREDANRLERLILTLTAAMNPGLASKLPEDVREQISELQNEKPVRRQRRGGMTDGGDHSNT